MGHASAGMPHFFVVVVLPRVEGITITTEPESLLSVAQMNFS